MGALTPVSTLLTGITTTLNTIESFGNTVQDFGASFENQDAQARRNLEAQQQLSLQQLQQQQELEQQQAAQDAQLQLQELELENKAVEEARQKALKRAVATQRASFGASGINASGGSAEAVLLGLYEESDDERKERERLTQLKTTALETNLDQQKSLNVLQLSQLKEKQRVERATLF